MLRKIKFHLGLDWIYAHNEHPKYLDILDNSPPLIVPPAEQLAELAEFAKIGDLRGLTERLKQLATDDFNYIPFAAHLQTLSKEFKLGDIKRLLLGRS